VSECERERGRGGKKTVRGLFLSLSRISLRERKREREKEGERNKKKEKKKKGEKTQYVVCSCHSREYLSKERNRDSEKEGERESVCESERAKTKREEKEERKNPVRSIFSSLERERECVRATEPQEVRERE